MQDLNKTIEIANPTDADNNPIVVEFKGSGGFDPSGNLVLQGEQPDRKFSIRINNGDGGGAPFCQWRQDKIVEVYLYSKSGTPFLTIGRDTNERPIATIRIVES